MLRSRSPYVASCLSLFAPRLACLSPQGFAKFSVGTRRLAARWLYGWLLAAWLSAQGKKAPPPKPEELLEAVSVRQPQRSLQTASQSHTASRNAFVAVSCAVRLAGMRLCSVVSQFASCVSHATECESKYECECEDFSCWKCVAKSSRAIYPSKNKKSNALETCTKAGRTRQRSHDAPRKQRGYGGSKREV